MERTTDIEKIKKGGLFTWGEVVKVHEIGEYAIAEYKTWKRDGCASLTGDASEEIEYHAWINGKDTSRGFLSLDSALAGVIAYKRDGVNSQAGSLFMRMVGDGD